MNRFLQRVRERRLIEWALAYLAGTWLALQVLDVLKNVWPLSLTFQRAVHILLAFGFPAAIVLAWYHGEKGRQRIPRSELLIISGLCAIAALSLPATGSPPGVPRWAAVTVALCSMLALPIAVGRAPRQISCRLQPVAAPFPQRRQLHVVAALHHAKRLTPGDPIGKNR